MDNDLAKQIVEKHCESVIGSNVAIVRDPRGLYTEIKNALCASTTEQVTRLREAADAAEKLIVTLYGRDVIPTLMQYEVDKVRSKLRAALQPKAELEQKK